ncbi:MAG: isopenicillin N synthase family oxygenase [Bdellovibrionales bacterium]|nr:isopenicillin N synthase family oxygenase [Bdellovibrionales bacterium]
MLPHIKLGATAAGDSLCQALHGTGFLYLSDHGIPRPLQLELLKVARLFFAEPQEQKNKLEMKRAGSAWRGYFATGAELTMGEPDQKEGLYFGVEHEDDHPGVLGHWPMHGRNLWPTSPALKNLEPLVLEYIGACEKLGQTLMARIAVALGLSESYFLDRFTEEPTLLFRIFNYPAPAADGWGVAEHTDMGFLTLLFQDEKGGLEVLDQNSHWTPVPPREDTLVINIGDMLEYWTHGIFRATPHRVRNLSKEPRLSLPFFFDPNWNATLEPIPREILSSAWLNRISPDRRKRWDGLELHALSSEKTYGDFVWSKIRNVFPELAAHNLLTDKRNQ